MARDEGDVVRVNATVIQFKRILIRGEGSVHKDLPKNFHWQGVNGRSSYVQSLPEPRLSEPMEWLVGIHSPRVISHGDETEPM